MARNGLGRRMLCCIEIVVGFNHKLRVFFGSVIRFTILRPQTLEWWATMFRKYVIVSNQLDKSFIEFNPNS